MRNRSTPVSLKACLRTLKLIVSRLRPPVGGGSSSLPAVRLSRYASISASHSAIFPW